jgi:hypothetical protein
MSAKCAECERLWEHFAHVNRALLQLIEEKYARRHGDAALEKLIGQAVEERQRAKTSIVYHEHKCHAPPETDD